MGIKSGSIGPGGVENNQSVFGMALANQEQHSDLDTHENRNKHDICFKWPWRYKNDQCGFGVALADREQRIVFDWPWREKNDRSVFGMALANQYVCARKCMQKCTFAAQAQGKTRGGVRQVNGQCTS